MINYSKKDFITILIETGLILLLTFTPIAFGTVEMWSITAMQLLVALIMLLWIYKLTKNKDKVSVFSPAGISVFIFIGLIIIQLIPLNKGVIGLLSTNTYHLYEEILSGIGGWSSASISVNSNASYVDLLKVIAYAMIFFIIINNIRSENRIKKIFNVIILIGFIIAVFAIIQKLSYNGKIFWLRKLTRGGSPFGPFVNRDHYAGYMGMIVPIALCKLFTIKQIEKRMLLGFCSVIMISSLILSLSRGGVLFFMAGVIFLSVMLFLVRKSDRKKLIYLLGIIFTVFLFVFWLGVAPVIDRLSTLAAKEKDYFPARMPTWRATVELIKDYPVTGTGIGTFEYVFPKYRTPDIKKRFRHAHNDYIQLLAEMGIPGVIVVSFFFTVCIGMFVRRLKNNARKEIVYYQIGGITSCMIMLLHSFFDFNLRIPSNALLFIVITGLTYSASLSKKSKTDCDKKERKKHHILYLTAVLLITVFYAYLTVRNYRANYFFKQGDFENACRLDNNNALYHYRAGLSFQKQAVLEKELMSRRLSLLKNSEKEFTSAIRNSPSNGRQLTSYAWLCGVFRKHDTAKKYFDLAVKYDPQNKYLTRIKKKYEEKSTRY